MQIKNKIFVGALAVVISALLWSLDGTFLRPHLASLPPSFVVFLEHSLGFVILLPFLFIYKFELKNITKKQWLTIFWVALFGGALGTTFFTKALFLTGFVDVSVVILLQKFQPIFAILLSAIILRERFPAKFYIYAFLALIGGYFVTFKDPTSINFGNATTMMAIFSLLAAFSWGSSTTFGKYSLKNINYGLLSALRFGFTIIIMLIPAIKYFSTLSSIEPNVWKTLAIIVFTSGAVAMYLYYFGLKKIPASLATLCELAWPVSAVIFDYFFNNNILSITQITGATLLIISVTLATRLNKTQTISGIVLPGANNGEKVGARTANLDVALAKDLAKGLYSCKVSLEGTFYRGLIYYGFNSLTNKDCLEIHILEFNDDLYGKNITATTERYLRFPKKFKSVEKLSEQIKKDLSQSFSE
ncbi:EamA family transporter [Candidatus Nomurabacteria bacterium CG22_combo_CG10-13_8_21_14_all_32_8]|uniref:riboflavin kinase n=3 Tax=Candidatus Nomuraibacteriota TaxID=1752729 RepID=A0A2H0CI51_9BACT|nr:MAG: EamA family transporter [Candidatus Nomurabacteria bacterium CG22_combo_CG10-13_8_21_14_all_32_8]PIZ86349.1 MAG: EamA family transporter [Candidatus Nomurabacteria bacterium CG_4_10_14_0_2_um_filter_33_9]